MRVVGNGADLIEERKMTSREKLLDMIHLSELVTVQDWIASICNCREVAIDEYGDVWISGPQSGHWLDDEDMDRLVARIDSGV